MKLQQALITVKEALARRCKITVRWPHFPLPFIDYQEQVEEQNLFQ
jgi:hypothetical protein